MQFPPGFTWGTATSAYQIEGAAALDGRAPSVWDTFCRRPGAVVDGGHGDVACDHYHRWAQDLDLMFALGLQAYRFSVAWPRVQPDGSSAWNEQGLAFYDRLVDGILARGMQPHVTLYHWDLPQALQDRGGWAERDTALRFVDYAQGVARRLGDRVRSIVTHNEPWVVATLGHESGIFAPGIKNRRVAMQASHHLLLSHALALPALRAEAPKAELGIVLNLSPIHAATDKPEDIAKAKLDDGLLRRWYMDPLMHGRYPADVLEHLGADAPVVASADMKALSTPFDFLGVNYYTRNFASANPWQPALPPENVTDMGWEVYPQGLTELLLQLKQDYPGLPPIAITENGAAYPDVVSNSRVHDTARVDYLRSHIRAVHDAIRDGVDVRGYFVWSFLDNFEWALGYSKRFGIVHVDYATQARTLKDSACWYRDFIAAQRVCGATSTATSTAASTATSTKG